jgi:hypothetical protein
VVVAQISFCGILALLPDADRFGGSTLLRMGTARLELLDADYAISDKAFRKSSFSCDRE